jgi:hypothetical protein
MRVGILNQRASHGAESLSDLSTAAVADQFLCDDILPLEEALEKVWSTDAHLLLYTVAASRKPDAEVAYVRANKRSPFLAELIQAGGEVRMNVAIFDYDLPKVDGAKQPWVEGCQEPFIAALYQEGIPAPSGFYFTAHGARIIHVLEHPLDPGTYERFALALRRAYLAVGIELDESCKDWTRLFRLPHVTRQDTGQEFKSSVVYYDPAIYLPSSYILEMVRNVPAEDLVADSASRASKVSTTYEGTMPTPEQVEELLWRESGKRRVESAWQKKAKLYLQGRESFLIAFGGKPIDCTAGRDNAIMKLVGQVIGMTARQEEATPEGIYAILYAAITQIPVTAPEENWLLCAWDKICRVWAQESAIIEKEFSVRAEEVVAAGDLRQRLIEVHRKRQPEDVPSDTAEAEMWLRQRMIVAYRSAFYIMDRQGEYSTFPVGSPLIMPLVKDLGMCDVIETHEVRGKVWAQRSVDSVIADHVTPVKKVVYSSIAKEPKLDGPRGARTLVIPVHRLNPNIVPEYSAEVSEWLRALAGARWKRLEEWLSHALDVARPICALNLYGAPGAGKGMLVQGLAECFESETFSDSRSLDRFNDMLLESPVINCDEGVPKIKGLGTSVDQVIRSLITGGQVSIESKGMPLLRAEMFPRLILTSNDANVLDDVVGRRDLTDDDVSALSIRILSIHVSPTAPAHLEERGQYSHTQGWVKTGDNPKYTIARHIAWLYANRYPVTGKRLLVEGEQGSVEIMQARASSPASDVVLRAILKMLQSKSRSIHHQDGGLVVSTAGVFEAVQIIDSHSGVNLQAVGRTMKNWGEQCRDSRTQARAWYLDMPKILSYAIDYGMRIDTEHWGI